MATFSPSCGLAEGGAADPSASARCSAMSATTRIPRAVQLPLSADEWVTVQAPFPHTEEASAQMLRVVEGMKPGLVESDEPELESG